MIESKNQNILIITSRADFGGGPEHVFQLINQLKNDFNFFVACPNDYPYYKLYSKLLGTNNIFEIPHRKVNLALILKLYEFIKKKEIRLIHSHGKGAGIYSRLLFFLTSSPIVHTFHGVHIEKYSKIARVLYLTLEKFFSLFTLKFISVSNSEKDKILKYRIAKASKVVVIPNGVNIPTKTKTNLSEDLNILFITRDDLQKNNNTAVRIAKLVAEDNRIKNVKMNIIGSGLDSFVEQVEKDGIKDLITWHGSQLNLDDYFANSDFYINTSFAEGFSLSILEAMAHGLPIIASRVTGNIDIVKDNVNGFLFELDTPETVIEKIVICKLNRKLYQKISLNNINLIKEYFSVQQMAAKTKSIYMEILNEQ